MRNTINDKVLKSRDILNRRQDERPIKLGIHDISCSRYFTIGDQSFRYALKTQQFSSDYSVYSVDDGKIECIGFASPINGKKFEIRVRRHGLDWSSRVLISDVKVYGTKNPDGL
jgi:hypothetical protein